MSPSRSLGPEGPNIHFATEKKQVLAPPKDSFPFGCQQIYHTARHSLIWESLLGLANSVDKSQFTMKQRLLL